MWKVQIPSTDSRCPVALSGRESTTALQGFWADVTAFQFYNEISQKTDELFPISSNNDI